MTEKNNNYIKDIESYFLNLKGKGIMLSSRDYELINNWRERSIPKNILIDAIAAIFNQFDQDKYPSISKIENEINEYIKDKYLNIEVYESDNLENNKLLCTIIKNIESFKRNETRLDIINVYSEIKAELIKLKNNKTKDTFKELKKIESKYLDKLLLVLDEKTKKLINEKSYEMLPVESKFYDEQTKEITLRSYIKDLVLEKLKIRNIFDLKNDKSE